MSAASFVASFAVCFAVPFVDSLVASVLDSFGASLVDSSAASFLGLSLSADDSLAFFAFASASALAAASLSAVAAATAAAEELSAKPLVTFTPLGFLVNTFFATHLGQYSAILDSDWYDRLRSPVIVGDNFRSGFFDSLVPLAARIRRPTTVAGPHT